MRCGIGCRVLQHGADVLVQQIQPNGSVHFSGKIAVGDFVVEVDGERVEDAQHARELIAGESDSLIVVKIRRGGAAGGDIESVPMLRQDGVEGDANSEEDMMGIAAALHLIKVGVHVDQVIPGGPAWCTGVIRAGTIVTAIDGVNVVGGHLHPSELQAMIRGAVGTRVNLEIAPETMEGSSSFVDLVRLWTLLPEAVRSYRASLHEQLATQRAHIGGAALNQRLADAASGRPASAAAASHLPRAPWHASSAAPGGFHARASSSSSPPRSPPASPPAWDAPRGSHASKHAGSNNNNGYTNTLHPSASLLAGGARGRFVELLRGMEELRRGMDREEEEMAGRYEVLSEVGRAAARLARCGGGEGGAEGGRGAQDLEALARTMDGLGAVVQASMPIDLSP